MEETGLVLKRFVILDRFGHLVDDVHSFGPWGQEVHSAFGVVRPADRQCSQVETAVAVCECVRLET